MKELKNLSSQQSLELIGKSLDDLDNCLEQLRSCPEPAAGICSATGRGLWDGQFFAAIAEMRENIMRLSRSSAPEQSGETAE